MAAVLIILTAALCVLSTLIGWVFDRRRDFAIMKALGASGGLIQGFFAAEAAALGAVGAVIGFAIGVGVAAWIGRVNFHAPVVPRFAFCRLFCWAASWWRCCRPLLRFCCYGACNLLSILRGE